MTPMTEGFSDELVKLARLGAASRFMKRLKKSPQLRRSMARAGALGGGTAVAAELLGGDVSLASLAKAGLIGTATGAGTGAAFPAWFSKANMRAADELRKRGLLSRMFKRRAA